ncbi:MAG: hypothetical protein R3321_07595 [Nitrososphaeraceae archaeon]|nr:hypothetical protein [Nitrososphaeraceae archaeon]
MNYNLKIVLSVSIVFAISLSFLMAFLTLSVSEVEIYELQNKFYSKDFSSDVDKIFIIGASQTASLNATYIEHQIKKSNYDYDVYNLSIISDRPITRLQTLDEIISMNPSLVVYGVGFLEFENLKRPLVEKPESIFPDPEEFFRDQINLQDSDFLNSLQSPKFITLQTIRDVFFEDEKKNLYLDESTPFFTYDLDKKRRIVDLDDLRIKAELKQFNGIKPLDRNPEVPALQKIIKKFNENEIKVILISCPFPKPYFEFMPDYYEERLNSIIDLTEDASNKNYYSFLHEYENMNIWSDLHHVSINDNVKIFNDDIVEIILKEIPST